MGEEEGDNDGKGQLLMITITIARMWIYILYLRFVDCGTACD